MVRLLLQPGIRQDYGDPGVRPLGSRGESPAPAVPSRSARALHPARTPRRGRFVRGGGPIVPQRPGFAHGSAVPGVDVWQRKKIHEQSRETSNSFIYGYGGSIFLRQAVSASGSC